MDYERHSYVDTWGLSLEDILLDGMSNVTYDTTCNFSYYLSNQYITQSFSNASVTLNNSNCDVQFGLGYSANSVGTMNNYNTTLVGDITTIQTYNGSNLFASNIGTIENIGSNSLISFSNLLGALNQTLYSPYFSNVTQTIDTQTIYGGMSNVGSTIGIGTQYNVAQSLYYDALISNSTIDTIQSASNITGCSNLNIGAVYGTLSSNEISNVATHEGDIRGGNISNIQQAVLTYQPRVIFGGLTPGSSLVNSVSLFFEEAGIPSGAVAYPVQGWSFENVVVSPTLTITYMHVSYHPNPLDLSLVQTVMMPIQ